jgi:transposase-like protein
MPQKGTISSIKKISAIREYLNGETSLNQCAQKYEVSIPAIKNWLRLYKNRGNEGLMPATKKRKYQAETKQRAVTEYQSGQSSIENICEKYDISSTSIFRDWIRWYNGHEDFKQPNSGGAIYMTKGRKTTLDERIEIVSHCIANNKDYGKTIEKFGVSYQQIYGWVRKYEKDGADGLVDNRGKRKDEASMNEVDKLRAQLKLKEAENLRLQMENDLLKKLEALERGLNTD